MEGFSKGLIQLAGVAFVSWLVVGTGLWILRGPSGGTAMQAAVAATVVVGAGLWWLSGVLPLRSTPWPGVFGVHAVVALLFGSLMVAGTHRLETAASGETLREAFAAAPFLGGEFAFWTWLYAVMAVSAYGLRTRDELRTERRKRAEYEAGLAEARLAVLRGQLDPHFLFNALHSVGALVHEDPARAAEALERLGDLLRFSLDETGEPVRLAEEVGFTQAYIDLVTIALGARLRLDLQIDEAALDADVPPFSLQVLTENAVRHGIAPLAEGGSIEVRVRRQGDELEMIVENDVGPERGPPTTGQGLTSLNARIEAMFGTDGRLDAGALPNGRFRARLSVPLP